MALSPTFKSAFGVDLQKFYINKNHPDLSRDGFLESMLRRATHSWRSGPCHLEQLQR